MCQSSVAGLVITLYNQKLGKLHTLGKPHLVVRVILDTKCRYQMSFLSSSERRASLVVCTRLRTLNLRDKSFCKSSYFMRDSHFITLTHH